MEKMNHLYDNYQLYINEKMPQKWHFKLYINYLYKLYKDFKPANTEVSPNSSSILNN